MENIILNNADVKTRCSVRQAYKVLVIHAALPKFLLVNI